MVIETSSPSTTERSSSLPSPPYRSPRFLHTTRQKHRRPVRGAAKQAESQHLRNDTQVSPGRLSLVLYLTKGLQKPPAGNPQQDRPRKPQTQPRSTRQKIGEGGLPAESLCAILRQIQPVTMGKERAPRPWCFPWS